MPPSVLDLRQALSALSLDSRGNKDALKKRLARHRSRSRTASPSRRQSPGPLAERTRPPGQHYDSFLVFDVEATCDRIEGTHHKLAFAYPNEIIEWPVILLQWRRRDGPDGDDTWVLEKVDEYHSFVKPMWKPQLTPFCTELTGIEQADVDAAPTFPTLLRRFYNDFALKHRLFTPENNTVWATDGPWGALLLSTSRLPFRQADPVKLPDLRDFIAKACYLSKTPRPPWLAGEIIDLSTSPTPSSLESGSDPSPSSPPPPIPAPLPAPLGAALAPASLQPSASSSSSDRPPAYLPSHLLRPPPTLSIPSVLLALTLPPFSGRLHSGLSDARNLSRIVIDLAARGVALEPNRRVPDGGRGGKERRWGWMGWGGGVEWEKWSEYERRREGRSAAERGEVERVRREVESERARARGSPR
ncbi:SPOSA6832_01343, partial [Sporobolomyces salmonicolor]